MENAFTQKTNKKVLNPTLANKTILQTLQNPSKPLKSAQKNQLLIVIFYGVSCLGKTTFSSTIAKFCKSAETDYHAISFDEPGGEVISRFKEENPEITDREEIFFRCWAEITALFHKRIFEIVNSLESGRHVLFVDDGKIDPKILKKLSSDKLKPGFAEKFKLL